MLEIPDRLRAVVQRRLKEEQVVWLTTVGSDLTPQPRLVWFIWQDDAFLIYSQPQAYKVRHVAKNPRVALHFNSDAEGNEMLVFTGEARIDPEAPPAHKNGLYLAKYRQGVAELGISEEEMAREYSTAIRVIPTSVRGD